MGRVARLGWARSIGGGQEGSGRAHCRWGRPAAQPRAANPPSPELQRSHGRTTQGLQAPEPPVEGDLSTRQGELSTAQIAQKTSPAAKKLWA